MKEPEPRDRGGGIISTEGSATVVVRRRGSSFLLLFGMEASGRRIDARRCGSARALHREFNPAEARLGSFAYLLHFLHTKGGTVFGISAPAVSIGINGFFKTYCRSFSSPASGISPSREFPKRSA
jgi:hypothetical protein